MNKFIATKVIYPKSKKYVIFFNHKTGEEVLTGVNGNPDPFVLESPSMIDIGIMGHCSNNCDICYQGNINIPNMTIDNFKLIIDQTKSHINQVALGGKGDPNKHENFKEILEYCRINNVVPNYTTSGNGLTDQEVEITKEYCGAVAVSSYDKDFTYLALNKFINAGVKTNIHFVVSSRTYENACSILEGIDIWKGKFDINKLNAVVFLLFKPQGNGADKKHLCLEKDELEVITEKIFNPRAKFKIGVDSCFVNKMSQVRELTENEKMWVDTCEGSRMSCYISPDMMFMPCSFGDKNKYGLKISNDSPIQNIWKIGKSFNFFRQVLKKNPMSCPYEL